MQQASLQGIEVCQGSPNRPSGGGSSSKSSGGKGGWVVVGLFIAACFIYVVGGAVFMKVRCFLSPSPSIWVYVLGP